MGTSEAAGALAQTARSSRSGRAIARGAGLLALADVALLGAGVAIVPRAFATPGDWAGLAATSLALLVCGYALTYSGVGIGTRDHAEVTLTLLLGAVYGLGYGGLILSEYLVDVTGRYSELTGTLAIALLAAICLVAGIAASRRTGSVAAASLAAIRAAMIGALIWAAAYLTITYAFWGTSNQEMVLRAEGTFDDFAREGGSDFAVFFIRDIQGAIFFHTLLSALAGLVIGVVGGVIGKLTGRLR